MSHKFIVLEGLSASGKSTIAKILAERLRAKLFKTPPSPFDTCRDLIDGFVDNQARFLFYLAANFQASSKIKELLLGGSVVCDRYILTTICYHRALGVSLASRDLWFNEILIPDYTFLIICEKGKRTRRLHARGLSFNDLEEERLGINSRFLEEYRSYPNVIEIDNSEDTPEIAVKEIISYLKE